MLSRFAAGALALVLSCLPLSAQTSPEGCIREPAVLAVLQQYEREMGGRLITIVGSHAQEFADEWQAKANSEAVEGVDLIIVHRAGGAAQMVVFVNGCATYRLIVKGALFDAVYGAYG